MGIVECYGWQNFSNLFNLQFCMEFSLYQLLSSIYALRSTIHSLSSTSYSLHSYVLRCTICPLSSKSYQLLSALYALRSTLCALPDTFCTLRSTLYDLTKLYQLLLCTLRSTLYPLLSMHYLLSSTPYAVRSTDSSMAARCKTCALTFIS